MGCPPPLRWVVFAPTGILPMIAPTSTMVTSTMVLVSSVEVTLVTLVLGTLVTRPMVILGLLVSSHKEGWGTSGVEPLTVFITG